MVRYRAIDLARRNGHHAERRSGEDRLEMPDGTSYAVVFAKGEGALRG